MINRTLAAIVLLAVSRITMAYEEPEYSVQLTAEDYEIRQYAEYIVAEVDMGGDMSDAGNDAFRILAGYIFGDNVSREKMNMTAPVESTPGSSMSMNMTAPVEARPSRGETGGSVYAFVMERKYTLETLPQPLDPRIELVTRPARTMAVRQYSGTWSESNYIRHRDELLEALLAEGIEVIGGPVWARYNSPFTPWFLRRNEVMFEVAWSEDSQAQAGNLR